MNKVNVSAAAFACTDIYVILAHKFASEPTVFVFLWETWILGVRLFRRKV